MALHEFSLEMCACRVDARSSSTTAVRSRRGTWLSRLPELPGAAPRQMVASGFAVVSNLVEVRREERIERPILKY
jgi:hypothetical protein